MTANRKATIVIDLGYGDCTKGSVTDFLVRERQAHTVIRFNGGGQAGHNVVTPDGRHHTFSQFGSGSFLPWLHTHLSRFMIVSPLSFMNEGRRLESLGLTDIFDRISVCGDCLVVTPFHWAANHLREYARGANRHGSCGLGIGEAVYDRMRIEDRSVFVRDLLDPAVLRRKLKDIQQFKRDDIQDVIRQCQGKDQAATELNLLDSPDTVDLFLEPFREMAGRVRIVDGSETSRLLQKPGYTVFESAQGVLLDQNHGFHPYTTWSRCTPANALELLAEADYDGEIEKLGLVRSYSTRHGAGPFVTEAPFLTTYAKEAHNGNDPWQQGFRAGWFDAVTARYAIRASGGIDRLAVSHLDWLQRLSPWMGCSSYELLDTFPAESLALLTEGFQAGLADSFMDLKNVPTEQVGLRPRPHQESLTGLLGHCLPRLQTIVPSTEPPETRAARLLEWIADRLGTKIGLTSDGPTADDKTLLY